MKQKKNNQLSPCVSMERVHFSAEQVMQCVNFCAGNICIHLSIDVIYIVWL